MCAPEMFRGISFCFLLICTPSILIAHLHEKQGPQSLKLVRMTLPTFDPEYELAGRVGTIVIERAQLQVSNGIPTEGQRTLFRKVNYDSENRQSEELNYDQNGILTSRSLHFYDGGGDLRVIKTYSPDGSLIHRRVYNENLENRTIEELAYSGRGTPEVTKTVYSLDENGKIVRQTTLTSFGQPSITLLMHYDKQDKVSEVSICVSGSENLAIIPGPAGKSVELSVE